MQRRKSSPVGLGIRQGRQGLLHQHHALIRQPGDHLVGALEVPAPIGIDLQFIART